ncbi:MAG: T9SS type A sorting domain-containing protein [Sporocytophaga sp.]|uniref:T9SS type A sorting domain-containing protein n=1 Tax=Sporocytophaga sp. TaxID=2231183 RepID=UPI001B2B105C|nr:T9SS type A sorting domain-containing protein [Sporocytophaga sp.]MBO9699763.1 T9SS type A sorting domain-containing protein [Sporocytophaga sp.]
MKKTFTILSLILGIYTVQAQPEINSLVVVKPGTTIKAYAKEDATVTPGNAGANQVWDFSGVTFNPADSETSTALDPSKTPYASSFPTATLAETSDNINYAYYKMSATEQVLLGNYGVNDEGEGMALAYTDPLTIIKTPLTYGGTQTDDYFVSVDMGLGFTMDMSGSITNVYDGYGTLKTVNGTYNNVVRLKSTKVDVTSFFGIETTINSVTYAYYIPGYTNSLFAISEIKVTAMDEEETTNVVYLYDPSFLTSNKNAYLQDLKLSVSPNPANNFVTVDFKDLTSGNYTLKITEQNGASVMENNMYVMQGDVQTIDIAELKSGMYFLEVASENGKTVKKIVKQ